MVISQLPFFGSVTHRSLKPLNGLGYLTAPPPALADWQLRGPPPPAADQGMRLRSIGSMFLAKRYNFFQKTVQFFSKNDTNFFTKRCNFFQKTLHFFSKNGTTFFKKWLRNRKRALFPLKMIIFCSRSHDLKKGVPFSEKKCTIF